MADRLLVRVRRRESLLSVSRRGRTTFRAAAWPDSTPRDNL